MNRKNIAIIVLGLVLLACLLACGYFGVKAVRSTRLRRAAMEAYEKKDYPLAERLLLQYIRKDPNAEAEYVALANIYHEFGNTGLEAQMWQTASSLDPLKPEYREKMLTSAVLSASYSLLHSILGRKARLNEKFTDQELYLYVISSFRSGNVKDGNDAYQKAMETNPEAFHKSDLGYMAKFMVNYSNLSEAERNNYLNEAMQSEDPVTRFEAVYIAIRRAALRTGAEAEEDYEKLLKQAMDINYFAGTPLLADFYFSECRFGDAFAVLEPYLKTIDDINMYLRYAECCVYEGKPDELKVLEKKLRRKPGILPFVADYCAILIPFMEKDEKKLAAAVHKSGNLVNTPLSRFIRLYVAMTDQSFSEIRTVAQEIFSTQPFHDLHDRALLICIDYISNEMKKPENLNDPSRMADLSKILSGYLHGNPMLTEIILLDQHKKGLAKEEDLMAALKQFPDSSLLQHITAEYLILNGKAEEAMSVLEPILASANEQNQEPDNGILLLHMLAQDQLGQRDETSSIFLKLLEQSEFDLNLLSQYLQFCVDTGRTKDLTDMADKLDTVKDGKLKHAVSFFRAAALLTEADTNKSEKETESEEETEEDTKVKEALDLLAATPTDNPDFTFYAANRLCEYDRLDEAETKYKAILKAYHTPSMIYVNLSELYQAKGEEQNALEAAKTAFDMEKGSMLPAFIYAKRLSEAKRYEEAVNILNFPRRAVNYRENVIELWIDCMHHVIENSIAGERYMQAEEQCKHLLVISPDDEFGKENLEKVQKLIRQQNVKGHSEQTAPAV